MLLVVGLCGCNGDDDRDIPDEGKQRTVFVNINETILVYNVEYTFTKAYWVTRFVDGYKIFTVEINADNILTNSQAKQIVAIKYEMQNGESFNAPNISRSHYNFTFGPVQKNVYGSISCPQDYFNMGALPVAKVYFKIAPYVTIVLNVLSD
jgi:hypothetical protein